jgi:perosamine synthetase
VEVSKLIIDINSSLKEALVILEKTSLGTLFVVNSSYQIVGTITDGDIRRSLLINEGLESNVETIMNKSYTSLPSDVENEVILKTLNSEIKVIPLVDEFGVILDYATLNRIRRIPVASPLLSGNELAYVTDCIKTNWISSQGMYVRKFEEIFSTYHNNFHSLAVSNGTVAIHLALVALGIGPGDEVLVPNLTFAASVNAIIYTGATPVLVDIDPISWNIDLVKAEKHITNKTKAIMAVHLYGNVCDMNLMQSIAKNYNLFLVEDCAEALGSYYFNKPVGTFGDAATFSFFGNKTITTGEGGMVLFKNKKHAELGAVLRDHGMSKDKRYWHDLVGYNYRLTNLQAAIGVAQFEQLNKFVSLKRNIAHNYNNTLGKYKYFLLPSEVSGIINSYWLYTFLLTSDAPFSRQEIVNFLSKKGIETRPVFFPINIMPPYEQFANGLDFPISKRVSNSGISLPSSTNISNEELKFICNSIADFLENYNVD